MNLKKSYKLEVCEVCGGIKGADPRPPPPKPDTLHYGTTQGCICKENVKAWDKKKCPICHRRLE